ncbi:unnamed protein product [Dicrocoelium dendriticum]|nr:unnamed protein product [Dicrocoelium dendriticum]
MGRWTSAMRKTKGKLRRRPRLRVNIFWPYVWILVLFAACNVSPVGNRLRFSAERGITLTSAPVSTKKFKLVEES